MATSISPSGPPTATADRLLNGDVARLRSLIAEKKLLHPTGGENEDTLSFADMALGLSAACGLNQEALNPKAEQFREAVESGADKRTNHVVFVLCDGMGSAVMQHHLKDENSFLLKHNQPDKMRAIFPATTPAALTTLATGVWPGRHGAAGWELRDQKCCEYANEGGQVPKEQEPVQIRVLHKALWDMRTDTPLERFGFTDAEKDVFFAKSWSAEGQRRLRSTGGEEQGLPTRQMLFVNAYLGSGFTDYAQGVVGQERGCEHAEDGTNGVQVATDFSLERIGETALETLTTPEGPKMATEYFRTAIDTVLKHIKDAETSSKDERTQKKRRVAPFTYAYIYTAHPDKHMHKLGVEHELVGEIVRNFSQEIERLWTELKRALEPTGNTATLFVTADHGHVTVEADDMVLLPQAVESRLEYANTGATGKGRHAYFRVRAGLRARFVSEWFNTPELVENFILLETDVAAELGLFGPQNDIDPKCRPRYGDFVSVSIGPKTLIRPREGIKLKEQGITVGSHGSITPEELRIPYIILRT